MNREILFRGKRVDNNEWVYGYLIEYSKGGTWFIATKEDTNKHYLESKPLPKVIPETVGQYTGLTDKNGKKIFEGDIAYDKYFYWEVYFDDGAFWRRWLYPDLEGDREEEYLGGTTEDLEVIGNIYDKEVE